MTLVQLEYALSLQRLKSFGRAAESLGISQPGLSIQIRKLEEEIGLTLFDRSQKKIRPTPAGERFLERATLLLNEARQLRELANTLNQEFTGKLRLGVIPTLAPYLLPLFIQHLNETYPDLNIYVKEALTEEVLQGIKSGELDMGIIATPITTKTPLKVLPLFYETFHLYVARSHPLFNAREISLDEIPSSDLWLLKEGNCLRNQVDQICDLKSRGKQDQNQFFFESNSIESLCRIVEHRGGVTILPELTTLQVESEQEDLIKTIAGPRRLREVSAIHLHRHVRQNLLVEIADLIRNSVPKNMWKAEGEVVATAIRIE